MYRDSYLEVILLIRDCKVLNVCKFLDLIKDGFFWFMYCFFFIFVLDFFVCIGRYIIYMYLLNLKLFLKKINRLVEVIV